MFFITKVLNGKRYVQTHDEVDATECEMLTRFIDEGFRKYFEALPCNWNAFYGAERAIAFRDGCGYLYLIFGYRKKL